MWADIPPVRHRQHKKRVPNELAPIMLERVITMASNPGQIVVDPFGGAGTTFYAAEKLHRYWIGSEIGDIEPAVERLTDLTNGIVAQWESCRGIKKAKQRKPNTSQLSIPYAT
jgi:site-specific DNA-methyltransferase (adenine-specific)